MAEPHHDPGGLGREALQLLAEAGLALASARCQASVAETAARLVAPFLAAECELLPADEVPPAPRLGGAEGARLVLPLLHQDEPLGALVLTRGPGQPFSSQDRAFAAAFGARVAAALANACQYQRLQEQLRELQEREERETEARRQFEETQKRGGDDFARFLGSSPIAIAVALDPEAELVMVNPALGQLLRIPVEEGKPLSHLPPETERPYRFRKDGRLVPPQELPLRWATLHGQEVRNVEFEVLHADGSENSLFGHAIPFFEEDGRVKSCLAAFLDVTERKKAEAALAQADRNKDAFIALLSHELRTPLAAMSNAVYLLRRRIKDNPSLSRPCDLLERQLGFTVRLVDDLRDISRIKRGRLHLERSRVDVIEVARNVLEMVAPQAAARGLELRHQLPSEPVCGEVDAGRVQQILTNLLGNAIKYTDRGGKVEFLVELNGTEVRMVVRDSGIGISPEMLRSAFDLYRQADGALKRSEGGMGLGLALTRGLVELHGGSISVHSEGENRGSEFTVVLPLAPAERGGAE